MAVNKVILVGNVGKDPEVHYIESNVPVARFPFATSETYKSRDGEKITTTEWHNVVMWRGLAEVVEKFVKKGSQLYIEGKIRTRSYDDRDGNKRYITEIIADNMQILGKRSDSSTGEGQSSGDQFASAGEASGQPVKRSGGSEESSEPDEIGSAPDPFSEEPDDLPF